MRPWERPSLVYCTIMFKVFLGGEGVRCGVWGGRVKMLWMYAQIYQICNQADFIFISDISKIGKYLLIKMTKIKKEQNLVHFNAPSTTLKRTALLFEWQVLLTLYTCRNIKCPTMILDKLAIIVKRQYFHVLMGQVSKVTKVVLLLQKDLPAIHSAMSFPNIFLNSFTQFLTCKWVKKHD